MNPTSYARLWKAADSTCASYQRPRMAPASGTPASSSEMMPLPGATDLSAQSILSSLNENAAKNATSTRIGISPFHRRRAISNGGCTTTLLDPAAPHGRRIFVIVLWRILETRRYDIVVICFYLVGYLIPKAANFDIRQSHRRRANTVVLTTIQHQDAPPLPER